MHHCSFFLNLLLPDEFLSSFLDPVVFIHKAKESGLKFEDISLVDAERPRLLFLCCWEKDSVDVANTSLLLLLLLLAGQGCVNNSPLFSEAKPLVASRFWGQGSGFCQGDSSLLYLTCHFSPRLSGSLFFLHAYVSKAARNQRFHFSKRDKKKPVNANVLIRSWLLQSQIVGYDGQCWRTLEIEGKALGRVFKVGHHHNAVM